jgi:leucyl aminopeptidase
MFACSFFTLSLSSLSLAEANSKTPKVLLSIGIDAVSKLTQRFKQDLELVKKGDHFALILVPSNEIVALSHFMHDEFGRCGGFIFETDSVDEVMNTLTDNFQSSFGQPKIHRHEQVRRALTKIDANIIRANIETLSAFRNRFYKSQFGVQSQEWVGSKWKELARSIPDSTLQYFEHADYPQRSVILTIKGTKRPNEIVVLGGHGDSISGWNPSNDIRAPGADDNASGISSITEALRALVDTGFRPERTIKFMSYAAEEVGLRGSQDIATDFKKRGEQVVGVMQLDMTNYTTRTNEVVMMTDYTDRFQNEFIKELIKVYLPQLVVTEDECGYACSDHASWSRNGFPASIPFEARMSEYNHAIHSSRDTLTVSNNRADHASHFAKIALSYIIELSSVD